jgi:hypothetical protein
LNTDFVIKNERQDCKIGLGFGGEEMVVGGGRLNGEDEGEGIWLTKYDAKHCQKIFFHFNIKKLYICTPYMGPFPTPCVSIPSMRSLLSLSLLPPYLPPSSSPSNPPSFLSTLRQKNIKRLQMFLLPSGGLILEQVVLVREINKIFIHK